MNVRAKKTICEGHYIGLHFSMEKQWKRRELYPALGKYQRKSIAPEPLSASQS